MTETSPVSFTSLLGDSDSQRAETVGYPIDHLEVRKAIFERVFPR